MAISRHQVEFRLSGGASNTDPAAALGGAMSTVGGGLLESQSITPDSALTGCTFEYGANNATSTTGTLTYTASGNLMKWTPPGGAAGLDVACSSDGTYTLLDADSARYIVVTVVAASLPGTNATRTITVANNVNTLFDDIEVADSIAGDTEYRCIYVKNAHGADSMSSAVLWIDTQTPGPDSIEIGLDPAGAGGTATTIANENTVPSGVAFSAPTGASTGLSLGTLTAGQSYAVWIKRTIAAGTTPTTVADYSALKLRFA